MATIRIPESAEPLLPFCRTSGSNGPHIWETFADLVAFLAALGYGTGVSPTEKIRPLKSANPIDLATFRSRGLYPQLLMLAIADRRDWLVSKQPDSIATISEGFADVGAMHISDSSRSDSAERVQEALFNEIQAFESSHRSPAIRI